MGCELIGSFGMGGLCAGFWKANLKRSRSRFVGPKKEFRTHRDFQTEAVFLFLGVLFFWTPFWLVLRGDQQEDREFLCWACRFPRFESKATTPGAARACGRARAIPWRTRLSNHFRGWLGLDWTGGPSIGLNRVGSHFSFLVGLDWFGGEMDGKALFTLYKNQNFKSPNQSKPRRSFRGLDWLVAWDAYACLSTINLRFQQARTTPFADLSKLSNPCFDTFALEHKSGSNWFWNGVSVVLLLVPL